MLREQFEANGYFFKRYFSVKSWFNFSSVASGKHYILMVLTLMTNLCRISFVHISNKIHLKIQPLMLFPLIVPYHYLSAFPLQRLNCYIQYLGFSVIMPALSVFLPLFLKSRSTLQGLFWLHPFFLFYLVLCCREFCLFCHYSPFEMVMCFLLKSPDSNLHS